MLLDLLKRYGGQSTDVTAGQTSALNNLTTAASGIPNFGESSSDAIRKLFSSSTTPQVGLLSDAYNRFQTNLAPTGGVKVDFAGGLSLRGTVATSNRFPPPVLNRRIQAPGGSTS